MILLGLVPRLTSSMCASISPLREISSCTRGLHFRIYRILFISS